MQNMQRDHPVFMMAALALLLTLGAAAIGAEAAFVCSSDAQCNYPYGFCNRLVVVDHHQSFRTVHCSSVAHLCSFIITQCNVQLRVRQQEQRLAQPQQGRSVPVLCWWTHRPVQRRELSAELLLCRSNLVYVGHGVRGCHEQRWGQWWWWLHTSPDMHQRFSVQLSVA